jgi:uncharacterized protein (TIGR00369 family)
MESSSTVGPLTPASIGSQGLRHYDLPINPDGVPEYFMGVGGIDLVGKESFASLQSGPWLSWDGHQVSLGSLGVLFDNVLAYPMLSGSSDQSALVSTEITIDSLVPLAVDAGTLSARGTLLSRDEQSAFATAELHAADGTLVAIASQRGRFVPFQEAPLYDYQAVESGTIDSSLVDLVWPGNEPPRLSDEGRIEVMVEPRLGNHMNCMHGGISILIAEWSAIAAARAQGRELATASLRTAYARPIPVGTKATFETTVLHLGRSVANVNVVARTEEGKCAVMATVTLQ